MLFFTLYFQCDQFTNAVIISRLVYHTGLSTLNKFACFTLCVLPSCDSLNYANGRYLPRKIMQLIFAKACKTFWLMSLNVVPMKALLDAAAHFHNISFCPLSLLTAVCSQLLQMCLETFIIPPTEEIVTLPHRNLKSFRFPQKCAFRIAKPSPETRLATVLQTIQLTSITHFKVLFLDMCCVVLYSRWMFALPFADTSSISYLWRHLFIYEVIIIFFHLKCRIKTQSAGGTKHKKKTLPRSNFLSKSKERKQFLREKSTIYVFFYLNG